MTMQIDDLGNKANTRMEGDSHMQLTSGETSEVIELFADADALPRDAMQAIFELGARYAVQVVTVSSINHQIVSPNHITVDASPQATDMRIVSSIRRQVKTIVVTQDYGLAALVLGKGARALSPLGFEFTEQNIDGLLFERSLHAKERRAGKHHKGPRARTAADEQRFAEALERVIQELVAEVRPE